MFISPAWKTYDPTSFLEPSTHLWYVSDANLVYIWILVNLCMRPFVPEQAKSGNTMSQHLQRRHSTCNTATKKHLIQMPNIPDLMTLLVSHTSHIHPYVWFHHFHFKWFLGSATSSLGPGAPVLHCGPEEPDRWHESLAINWSPRCTCRFFEWFLREKPGKTCTLLWRGSAGRNVHGNESMDWPCMPSPKKGSWMGWTLKKT